MMDRLLQQKWKKDLKKFLETTIRVNWVKAKLNN